MPRSWWQLSPWSSCENSGGCWWSPWRKSCVDLGQDSRLLGQFIRWCIASFLTCLCEIQYVEMSYTPMPGDSNGNGWCQVKIVDEMFLFAWSWWSSDQHARINSNGRASASLDTTWLKTTEWWLLAATSIWTPSCSTDSNSFAAHSWYCMTNIFTDPQFTLIDFYIDLNVHYW